MNVVVLTYCQSPALLYGTLLVFKSIRVGFPTARIMAFDNGSSPDTRPLIERAASASGCEFYPMAGMHYTDFYRWLLLEQNDIPGVVIIDPDVIFWDCVEGWDFGNALMAGRLMPQMTNLGCTSVARLHPSHLWIPDLGRLRAECAALSSRLFNFDPIGTVTMPMNGRLFFWDTFAALFHALQDRCRAFGERELNAYDHLFFGSHMPIMRPGIQGDSIMRGHDAAARGNHEALRGIWRDQDAYFRSLDTFDPRTPLGFQGTSEMFAGAAVDTLRDLGAAQGCYASDAQLKSAIGDLCRNLAPPEKRTGQA